MISLQISDPMLANVSRTHCIIQNDGKGAWLVDNSSTNGTWRRLSCAARLVHGFGARGAKVLEPSEPLELKSGDCVLAGVHEFRVEEAVARSGCRWLWRPFGVDVRGISIGICAIWLCWVLNWVD